MRNTAMTTWILIAVVLTLGFALMPTAHAGHPCAHILICCRSANAGVTFLVNGEWNPNHDYGDLKQCRDILQKLKDAGIKTVIIDMTNDSQWQQLWDAFRPMVDNVRHVCREKDMQFFIFIGAAGEFSDWNEKAKRIWEMWAPDPAYRRYGHGDDRPMLLVFQPSEMYWPRWEHAKEEDKTYLKKFRIGTTQVNDPVVPQDTDGWGYRSKWQNKCGSVRLASPNGGIPPETWYHIDVDEWEKQVRWAKEASEYSIYGSYDDTCDSFFWGIADTSGTERKNNIYPDPGNPRYYYDVVKRVLTEEE